MVRIQHFQCLGQIQSLVGELRSCKPDGAAKILLKDLKSFKKIYWDFLGSPLVKTPYFQDRARGLDTW